MGNDLSRMSGQMDEQVKLLRGEVDWAPENADQVSVGIDDEIASLEGSSRAFRRAAQVGAHSGQQFLDAEGLGDVVVSAGVQCLDLGALMVTDGENQDGSAGARAD